MYCVSVIAEREHEHEHENKREHCNTTQKEIKNVVRKSIVVFYFNILLFIIEEAKPNQANDWNLSNAAKQQNE